MRNLLKVVVNIHTIDSQRRRRPSVYERSGGLIAVQHIVGEQDPRAAIPRSKLPKGEIGRACL